MTGIVDYVYLMQHMPPRQWLTRDPFQISQAAFYIMGA